MTTSDARLDRLRQDTALREEADTLRAMVSHYCRHHHGTTDELCPVCRRFLDYALKRLACCPFGGGKPVCAKCRIRCYRREEGRMARLIMRWSGPRLILTHPVLSTRHLFKSLTVTPPAKPRNRRKEAES